MVDTAINNAIIQGSLISKTAYKFDYGKFTKENPKKSY
jgi:hypothetical protein